MVDLGGEGNSWGLEWIVWRKNQGEIEVAHLYQSKDSENLVSPSVVLSKKSVLDCRGSKDHSRGLSSMLRMDQRRDATRRVAV